jgi:hypothetical protein
MYSFLRNENGSYKKQWVFESKCYGSICPGDNDSSLQHNKLLSQLKPPFQDNNKYQNAECGEFAIQIDCIGPYSGRNNTEHLTWRKKRNGKEAG